MIHDCHHPHNIYTAQPIGFQQGDYVMCGVLFVIIMSLVVYWLRHR